MNDFKNDYPVGFRVLNDKLEDTLYLENKAVDAVVEISNITEKPIRFVRREDIHLAGPTNYHFLVRFRPGILKADRKNLHQDKLIKQGWHLTVAKEAVLETTQDEYFVVFYFLHVGTGIIKQNEKLYLPLKNLQLDCEEGTQLTQVELTLNNITHEVNSKQTIITHSRHYNLPVVNHRGSPVMPLHIGFTNFNTVLNDGKTPNNLTLLIDNFQRRTPEKDGLFTFSVKKRSKMYIYFDVDEEDEDWSLNTPENVSNIELTTWTVTGNDSFKTVVYREGAMPVWELFPEIEDVVLQPHMTEAPSNAAGISDAAFMEIKLNGIVAGTVGGITKLYIRFENIPNYWDQTFAVPIIKQPMVFNGQNVGIGTGEPEFKLDVSGDIHTTGKLYADGDLYSAGNLRLDHVSLESGDYEVGSRLIFNSPQNTGKLTIGARDEISDATTDIVSISDEEQGKVSIGNANRSTILDVTGGVISRDSILLATPHRGNLSFCHTDEYAAMQIYGSEKGLSISVSFLATNGEGKKHATGGDAVRVLPNGNVGIGTTSPTSKLEVKGRIKDQTGFVTPVGGIIMYNGDANNFDSFGKGKAGTDVEGWVLCDGRNNTPDLRSRFIVGAQTPGMSPPQEGLTPYEKGKTDGLEKVVLKSDELAGHRHYGFGESSNDWPWGTLTAKYENVDGKMVGRGVKGSAGGVDEDNFLYGTTESGLNKAHENRPPFIALFYIQKL